MQLRQFFRSVAATLVVGLTLSLASANIIVQSGPRPIPSGGGGSPAYTPWYAESMDAGTLGANHPAFGDLSGKDTKVSNDLAGPFGEAKVVKVTITGGASFFGGTFLNSGVALSAGDQTWMRMYVYFPTAFCAGFGDSGDGTGHIKFLRYEFVNGQRLTGEISGFAHNACASTSAAPKMDGIATEISGQVTNNYTTTPQLVSRDQWVAVQWHLTHGTTVGTSALQMWVGTTFVANIVMDEPGNGGGGQYPSSPSNIDSLVLGDYFNGDPHQTTVFYLSNVIFTKEQPDTVDGSGRPYISPSTDAADFP